jgi:hypothetical protein
VTEYPDPTTGVFGSRCGTPESPAFQGLEGINPIEAAWASSRVVARLNAALSAAVAAANARPGPHPVFHFVTGISSRFATHGYCTGGGSPALWTWPNPRYISTPIDSLTSQGDPISGTLHPNDLGQRAIGEALFDAMRFVAEPLQMRITPAASPVAGEPVALTVRVSTMRGTPVPGATVQVDGQTAGTTDQTGTLTRTWTFPTPGSAAVRLDHDPFPAAAALVYVQGRRYTVSATPSPVAVDKPITLSLRASDASGQLVAGTFTVISGAPTASIRSGASADLTLAMRFTYRWEEGPNGKPRKVQVPICPEITFQPDSPLFDPRDVSDVVNCSS